MIYVDYFLPYFIEREWFERGFVMMSDGVAMATRFFSLSLFFFYLLLALLWSGRDWDWVKRGGGRRFLNAKDNSQLFGFDPGTSWADNFRFSSAQWPRSYVLKRCVFFLGLDFSREKNESNKRAAVCCQIQQRLTRQIVDSNLHSAWTRLSKCHCLIDERNLKCHHQVREI